MSARRRGGRHTVGERTFVVARGTRCASVETARCDGGGADEARLFDGRGRRELDGAVDSVEACARGSAR